MNYPSIKEYKEAILFAEDNFEQLKNLRPVLEDDGSPVMTSGNFAVVFKMKDEQTGKLHAVKCFLREQEGRAEAYRQIAEELEYVSSTFLTPIKYLEKELFVDTNAGEESEFPVLLMDWVEGETLDKFIRKHLDDQYELSLLAYQFSRLAMWLMPQPFAHGDLKPDNILVKGDGTLVLVDYDGMYVPAMKGQRARELGSPDFRHPSRTETDFDEHIDDFSLASILLSLKAIALQPSLLEEYGAQDRLLFSEKDYRNLSESSALGALQPLMQDAELASLYSLFILALSQNNLSLVSFRLFNLSRPERPQYEEEDLSTEVTDEDLANAWTDEYGAKYSKDRKRLLYVPLNLKTYSIKTGTLVICDDAFGEAFKNESTVSAIIIPSSVIIIGNYSFSCCCYMKTITIPDSVNYISQDAFYDCDWLKTIIVPRGKRNAFEKMLPDCINEIVEIGEESSFSSKVIDDDFLDSYKDEYDVIYSRDFKRILKAPQSITKYKIKEGTCVIGNHAFSGCKELNSIYIPDTVSVIGDNAFYGCSSLKAISLPRVLRSIGDYAFLHCENIKNIKLPNNVVRIGSFAFNNCKKLYSIFIPSNVKIIKDGAFSNNEKLAVLSVDEHNMNYDSRNRCNAIIESLSNTLVVGCSSTIIPDTVTKIGCNAFYACHGLKSLVIPKGVTDIGWGAFYKCSELVIIELPTHLKKVEKDVFKECEKLSTLYIPIGTKERFEELLPEYKDKLVEQVDEEGICLAYCSEESQACENKEHALWQPHSKIIKKNGKLGVVIDDGITKKQIIPFAYDTWFDYDGYETDIRENFFDNYQDYIGYFAIRNADGTFTIHGYDKDGNLTQSFICEEFSPDSYRLNGKVYLRHPADGVEYDDIRRMRMDCNWGSDTSYIALHIGNKWALKSDDLKTTYIDFYECDELEKLYWTPKGYLIEIKKEGKTQICLWKKNSGTLILPNLYDRISLRYFTTPKYDIIGACLVLKKCDTLAVCSNELQNISPFIFSKVGSMINDNEVKVTRKVNGKEYEFVYRIVNSNGWRYKGAKPFSADEVAAVERTEVVTSLYGNSLCIFMQSGGQTYIPLSQYSSLTVGDTLDLKTAMLITLCRDGEDDIYRVIE